jgi:PhnB protein
MVTCAVPYLAVDDAAAAIEFYRAAFDAEEVLRLPEPDGKISHAEIRIGDARLFLSDEYPDDVLGPRTVGGTSVMIVLEVDDGDALFDRAVAAGAKVDRPLQDAFDGALRTGKLRDPFGHSWMIAAYPEPISPEELSRRFHQELST